MLGTVEGGPQQLGHCGVHHGVVPLSPLLGPQHRGHKDAGRGHQGATRLKHQLELGLPGDSLLELQQAMTKFDQQYIDIEFNLQTTWRGRLVLVRVVYCQPPSNVDDLDVFKGIVIPSNDLLDVLVDIRVDGDVMYSAANVDMNPNNDDTFVLSEYR